jgi:hypothetical protein
MAPTVTKAVNLLTEKPKCVGTASRPRRLQQGRAAPLHAEDLALPSPGQRAGHELHDAAGDGCLVAGGVSRRHHVAKAATIRTGVSPSHALDELMRRLLVLHRLLEAEERLTPPSASKS